MYKEENTVESQTRIDNINELKSVVQEFEKISEEKSLSDFLQNATLSTDMDENANSDNYVTLMTIHSSKGLEFPVVFMVAVEEDIFPSSRSSMEESKLEEERRLCYVAITRAKEKLFITRAQTRMLYGRTNCNMASRFITEIDNSFLQDEKREIRRVSDTNAKGYSLHQQYVEKYKLMNENKKNDPQELTVGAKVKHKTFGNGMIVGKMGGKYTIAFEKVGLKTIDTSVVKLDII